MRINRNNYEEYFLIYLEGQLSQEETAQLQLFLKQNPELESELNEMASMVVKPDKKIRYPFKEDLKVEFIESGGEINHQNIQLYCIAFLENDLSPADCNKFGKYLQKHPRANEILNSFRQIKLTPEPEIQFPAKKRLKRTAGPVIIQFSPASRFITRVAAVFLILAGTGTIMWFSGHRKNEPTQKYTITGMVPISTTKINHPEIKTPPITLASIEPAKISADRYDYTINRLRTYRCQHIQTLPVTLPRMDKPSSPQYLLAMNAESGENESQANESHKSKTLIGKILRNLGGKISTRLDPAKEIIDFDEKEKITFWDVAEGGIKGYNFITNNEYELIREVNKNGKTRFISIQDRNEMNTTFAP